ncbi:MAG: 16S rRNA (cytosine(1402)-N(4))-methyltransferase RsmH [Planctomycetota bacterium]
MPVLVKEIINLLSPRPGETAVDATIGRGGHSDYFLIGLGQTGRLIGIDWDPLNIKWCQEKFKDYQNVKLFCDNFVNLSEILQDLNINQVDLILLDLGISSVQLADRNRGFSFQDDGPLDMRINRAQPLTAEIIINHYREPELLRIISSYGEERWTKRIVKNIIKKRRVKRIDRTSELADLVKKSVPPVRTRLHPATRVFQALRIEVNRELKNLEQFLETSDRYLKPGGRLGIISFHSLEDRLVKQTFREKAKQGIFNLLTKKPVYPSDEEMAKNPRSRSAKLRVAEKVSPLKNILTDSPR